MTAAGRADGPRATPEQARASDPAVSAWVSANAGSGKTHVLVQRVLRLLLKGADPARILCLTFTRAAAAEMANRIFAQLAHWASCDDTALAAALSGIDNGCSDAKQLAFARTLFARALETPGGLKIQTIHAFCERVLHQFAFEANVTAHFTVMDEAQSAQMRMRAQDDMLARALDEPALAAALDDMAGIAGEQRFAALMGAVIAVRKPLLAWIAQHGSLDAALDSLRGHLGVAGEDTASMIASDWLNSPHLPQERWRELAELLSLSGAKSDRERGDVLSRCLSAADDAVRLATYKAFVLTEAGAPRKTIGTKPWRNAHAALGEAIDAELVRAAALLTRERALEVVIATAALLRLGVAVTARFEALKASHGLLDYDDLIARMLDLLSRRDAASWVLYKLDGGIDHILVDEAQDTNAQQWEIVRLLAEEFFAGAGVRPGIRTIFAVGDEKQSIYSFQGAEPSAFERMRRYFARRVSEAKLAFEPVSLILSFRSVPVVLSAVDDVFRLEIARRGLSETDTDIVHTALRAADPGIVELWPVERSGAREDKRAWDVPLDRPRPDHPRLRLAGRIGDEVARLIAGATIVEKGVARAIAPGDILILVRRRNDLVDAMIAALRRRGVAVAGADRLVVSEHLAVQDLMGAGDVALLPQDDLTLAAVLKSPLIGLSEEALFTLAWRRGGTLWQALRARRDEAAYRQAYERMSGWMARADFVRPYDFFMSLLAGEGGRRALLGRLGPEAGDAIDEFLSLTLSYEDSETASLQGFLHWMRAQTIDIKRNLEEGRDEVRIMTVHGAKGLEAPVVFLADTCDLPRKSMVSPVLALDDERGARDGFIWRIGKADTLPGMAGQALERETALQRAEYRRLLYVAMTRARDRLYICGALGDNMNDPPEDSWYGLIGAALAPSMSEIGDGRLRRGEPPPRGMGASVARMDDDLPIPDWLDQKAAPEPMAALLRPSRLGEGEGDAPHPGGDGAATARQRGTFIHRLLELLPQVEPARRAETARRMAAALLPDGDTSTREAWSAEALALLEHPDLQPLFSAAGLSEISLAGAVAADEPLFLSGQIDRMAVIGDEVIVADYKTNRLAPDRPQDTPPAYLAQLAAYRVGLAPLFPDKRLRFYLIWTASGHVMEIEHKLLDSAQSALRA